MANEHVAYVFLVFKVLSLEMNREIWSLAVSRPPVPLFFKPIYHKPSALRQQRGCVGQGLHLDFRTQSTGCAPLGFCLPRISKRPGHKLGKIQQMLHCGLLSEPHSSLLAQCDLDLRNYRFIKSSLSTVTECEVGGLLKRTHTQTKPRTISHVQRWILSSFGLW